MKNLDAVCVQLYGITDRNSPTEILFWRNFYYTNLLVHIGTFPFVLSQLGPLNFQYTGAPTIVLMWKEFNYIQ